MRKDVITERDALDFITLVERLTRERGGYNTYPLRENGRGAAVFNGLAVGLGVVERRNGLFVWVADEKDIADGGDGLDQESREFLAGKLYEGYREYLDEAAARVKAAREARRAVTRHVTREGGFLQRHFPTFTRLVKALVPSGEPAAGMDAPAAERIVGCMENGAEAMKSLQEQIDALAVRQDWHGELVRDTARRVAELEKNSGDLEAAAAQRLGVIRQLGGAVEHIQLNGEGERDGD